MKSTIHKFQKDIIYFYNQRYTLVPIFYPSNKVFLNTLDIHTICPSAKLSYYHLRSYMVEKQVGPMSYQLKLSLVLQRLHLVFNIMKLTAVSEDPIPKSSLDLLPDSVIINKEQE